jgi:hypothetical protein
MSYYNAARKAGTCKEGVCEQDDYIYDAPHLSSGVTCSAQGTSYCEIEHKVHSRMNDDAGVNHLTPDVWENLWLSISEAA